jgi:hypothetical protein
VANAGQASPRSSAKVIVTFLMVRPLSSKAMQ